MIDFSVSIEVDNYLLDIISGSTEIDNLNTGTATIEINDKDIQIITLESSILDNINNLEIQKYNDYNLTLTNTTYANLPEEIPMSIITGNLHVSRIDDLDDYLTTIPIDGGSP
jgi:hypothetical protein